MRPDMAMTPRVPLTSDDIRSEFCIYCEAQPEVPCANLGGIVVLPGGQLVAPGDPMDEDQHIAVIEARMQPQCLAMPAGREFHAERIHAATSRRLQAEAVEDSLHLVASMPDILNTDEGEAP